MIYKRILLKLSGESLAGEQKSGISTKKLGEYVRQIKSICTKGVQVGIVIGGGNIFRGLSGAGKGFDRVKGDYMGMLATIINGLGLQSAFEAIDQKSKLFTAFNTEPAGERYSAQKAIDAMESGFVSILTGGTGNPFFTTDSGAALRAVEIKANILLKGTRVDGVYTSDPEKNPDAKKYETLTFDQAYKNNLKIMDLTAFSLCKENNMPIYVFDMDKEGNLEKVLKGEKIGTLVKV